MLRADTTWSHLSSELFHHSRNKKENSLSLSEPLDKTFLLSFGSSTSFALATILATVVEMVLIWSSLMDQRELKISEFRTPSKWASIIDSQMSSQMPSSSQVWWPDSPMMRTHLMMLLIMMSNTKIAEKLATQFLSTCTLLRPSRKNLPWPSKKIISTGTKMMSIVKSPNFSWSIKPTIRLSIFSSMITLGLMRNAVLMSEMPSPRKSSLTKSS